MDECRYLSAADQNGASLLVTLVLMAAIMMLGMTTARIVVQGEKAARNERDFRVAFFAAEAALRDAQADIDREDRDEDLFLPVDPAHFVNGCGTQASGKSHGLCVPATVGHPPVWLTVNLADANENSARAVAYGTYSGRPFPSGEGPLPARPPRYLIEWLSAMSSSSPEDDELLHATYRITAIGFGMRDSTHVVLQAVYRRERLSDGTSESDQEPYPYRSRRLSWREIPHWQELRDAINHQ